MKTDIEHPDTLLPFYVNGSLDADETKDVEQHINGCEHCQNEVKFLRQLRQQIKNVTPAQTPSEFGLQRLMRDVRKEKSEKKTANWWKPAMAAAVLVIMVQAGVLLQRPQTNNAYVQLGGPESGIEIIFQPSATEAQIRHLLNSIDARIIDGPSALGIYHIQLPGKAQTEQEKQKRAAMIETLRKKSNVVQEVSP